MRPLTGRFLWLYRTITGQTFCFKTNNTRNCQTRTKNGTIKAGLILDEQTLLVIARYADGAWQGLTRKESPHAP